MANRLLTRFELIQAFLSRDRDFPLSMWDLVANGVAKPPCTQIGPRFVDRIADDNDPRFAAVTIKSIATPLLWPRALPLFDLYKVVTECFFEADWHYYEVPETRVEPGDTVLDCGAAEGIFTLRVRERARRVIAFEPLPLFGESLTKTFAGCDNVVIESVALGDYEGQAFLAGNSLYGSVTSNAQGAPIQVRTIDRWAADSGHTVHYIKGDLEGYEMKVLFGAKETIRRDRPKIALTVYHPGNNWRQIRDFLFELVPEYKFRVKGLSFNARHPRPVMLHCWVG